MIKFYRGLKDSYSIAAHGSDIYFATDTLEILHGGNSYSGLNKYKTIKDMDFADGILTIIYTDGSTSEFDSNLVTKTELSNKVDRDDNAPKLTAGFANNLVGRGEATEETISFRPSGGDTSIEDGTARIERMKGNTVVWNQIALNSVRNLAYTYGNGEITILDAGISVFNSDAYKIASFVESRKYLIIKKSDAPLQIYNYYGGGLILSSTQTYGFFGPFTYDWWFTLGFGKAELGTYKAEIRIVDLTQMFGAGNEPTTIEEFNARKPIGIDEYAYNEGELISTTADEIKSVGFNAYNGGYAKVIGGKQYELVGTYSSIGFSEEIGGELTNIEMPSDKLYTPEKDGYIYAQGSDICIHLVHTGYRNGEYEPYEEFRRSIPISDIKDSEGNQLFPNGLLSASSVHDEITATKAIKRINRIVFDGSESWSLQSINSYGIANYYTTVTQSFGNRKKTISDKFLLHASSIASTESEGFILAGEGSIYIRIKSTTASTVEQFKTWLSQNNTTLQYELAEPIEVDLPEPLNLDYEVSDFGTEEVISDVPTTPLKADIIYQFNAVDRIRDNSRHTAEAEELLKTIPVVVNDLTTGGTDKALSAEMGKVLFEDIHGREGGIVTIPHTAIVNTAWTRTALDTPVNVGSTITSVYKSGVRLDTGTIYYISSSNESFSFSIASLPLFLETRNIVSIQTDSAGTYVLNEEQEQPSIDGIMQIIDGKESLANKATDLSSPNDTSYPTTKAVADAIAIAAEGKSYKKVDVPEGFIIYIPKDEKRVYSGVNILAMANVLDLANIVRGSMSNDSGEIVTDRAEGYITTYIPFKQNMWLLSSINNLVDNVYYYDKDYTFIKRKGSAISNAGRGSQITEDVSFIRFQIRLSVLDSATNPQILMHDGNITPSMVYKAYRFNKDGEVYQGEENFIWADGFNQFSYKELIQGDNIDRKELFDDMSLWEPSQVDSGYSNPSEGYGQDTKRADWTAENKYLYYDFLEHYYDGYLGDTEGYRVTRRSLCQDSSNTGHEIFEYDFCPINYQYTVMLSAGMNADETQGIWGLATFIRCLMNEEEPMLAIAKKNIRFKVIPIVNASGFDKDILSYYYSNGVNPNYNFNYKDSWSKQTKARKGDYPDSNIETQALKAWINENANKAVWWHDLHTGRFGDTLNSTILDLRFPTSQSYGNLNETIAASICNYYKSKGYVEESATFWKTGYAQSLSATNYDYAKHWYAYHISGIPNCMSEMHIESTGYGADGHTNNTEAGIKAYVLQIRILMMFMVNKYIQEHPNVMLQDNKIGKVQQMFD